jgi:probable rRNA maturation factor
MNSTQLNKNSKIQNNTRHIIIQKVAKSAFSPSSSQLRKWAQIALDKKITDVEITLRIIDKAEMIRLNATYRGKHQPTNILSFPFATPKEMTLNVRILGDIAICAEVVNEEAIAQNKPLAAHWAHMIVHGILHLLGYDHQTNDDAVIMESLEINILKTLGFNNPYILGENGPSHEE